MSYTNYSRNKYRNLSRPICPINVIVQDDNIKKPKPIPHLYYPNYPYSGYPGYPYPNYPSLGYPDYTYGYAGGYPGYLYPGIRPYVEGIDTNIEDTNIEHANMSNMPKPKSRSIEKTILKPGSKNHPNPHFYYDSSSSSGSDSDYRYRSHAKRDKKSTIRDPDIDPIFDPCVDQENIISKDMIPNRVFDEESIKTKPVDICNQNQNQNPKNYTKPFAKLVSKFITPETEEKEKVEKVEEKIESLGNPENQKVENQKVENDKKIYLK
jgi:hypothetical protein